MIKVLDLFSGIGGFSLGLERTGGFKTVAFCEIEDYPRRVLAKHWPEVPIYDDVRELTGERLAEDGISVDVICGGYPCQPFSFAGKRAGQSDDRHLWPEVDRLIREIEPTWFIGENVVGHISMGLDEVLSDLEGQGYTCWPIVIPACALNADHRRDRLWILANASGRRRRRTRKGEIQQPGGAEAISAGETLPSSEGQYDRRSDSRTVHRQKPESGSCFDERILADSDSDSDSGKRLKPREPNTQEWPIKGERPLRSCCDEQGWWPPEPRVGRVANGVPSRAHRIKALGNAVVPQIPEIIGRAILEAEHEQTNPG